MMPPRRRAGKRARRAGNTWDGAADRGGPRAGAPGRGGHSGAPRVEACPTGIDIPGFIRKIATDNVRGSARRILSANLLGYSCARVCPVEVLCVGACVYNDWHRTPPIAIGRLQRYATETLLDRNGAVALFTHAPATGENVACIGARPASLAA